MAEQDVTLKQQILDLVNLNNTMPFEVTSDNVMLSEARQVTGEKYLEVRVRGIQNQGYRKNPASIYYEPLDLEKIYPPTLQPTVRTLSQSTIYRLLPRLNAILGTQFTEDDIVDIDLSPYGNTPEITLTVTAKETSKFYTGSFTFDFKRHWMLLEEVVKSHVAALEHPDPIIEDMIGVGLLTWGTDFTSIKDSLAVDPTAAQYRGGFADIVATRDALSQNFGIWSWPDNRDSNDPLSSVKDMDTRDVPRANTNFKRVVVQTNVREKEYVGTAYFHYN